MVTITPSASMKLQEFLQTENKPGYGLRLIVEPGCCAEYTYGLDFAEKPAEGDSVFIRVLHDRLDFHRN